MAGDFDVSAMTRREREAEALDVSNTARERARREGFAAGVAAAVAVVQGMTRYEFFTAAGRYSLATVSGLNPHADGPWLYRQDVLDALAQVRL